MTPAQTKAVEQIRKFVESRLDAVTTRGDTIAKFEVKEYGSFISVYAIKDMEGLPLGNLLRSVSKEFWCLHVGKRGGVTVRMCPNSHYQFHGKRAFGFNYDVSDAKTRTHYKAAA